MRNATSSHRRLRRALVGAALAGTTAVAGVGAAGAASADTPYRPGSGTLGDHWFPDYGNGGYDATHYDVAMAFDPKTHAIDATTTVAARATQNLSRFSLDLDGLRVSDVRLDGHRTAYARTGHKLTVTPSKGLRKGKRFTVSVSYAGVPRPLGEGPAAQGFIPTNDGAFTLTSGPASDTWFPNNDDPKDKAGYTFRVRVPAGLAAVANGRLVSHPTGSAAGTYVWRATAPMASYLTTVDIGHWQIRAGRTPGGIPEYVAVDPQLKDSKHPDPLSFMYDTTAKVVDFWTKKFGPYPFDSTGAIVDYTDFDGKPASFSEETQTRPIYGSLLSEETIAHELSHQWFGDSVSFTDYSDIWLNEGFATWAAWYWDGLHGQTPVEAKVRQKYHEYAADSEFWKHPVTPVPTPDPATGARVYEGGAMAVQFLREKVGDPTFFRILQTWTKTHRHGHGTTAQFVRTAEKVSGRDLTAFFQDWVYGTGRPALP